MNLGSKPTSMSAGPVREPAVTFVIPVFNKERYLEQCLESVVAQSLVETEIICVNDGSTDASGQILAKFARLDRRLSVIDNASNLGAGQARNRGIAAATGSSSDSSTPTICCHANRRSGCIAVLSRLNQTWSEADSRCFAERTPAILSR